MLLDEPVAGMSVQDREQTAALLLQLVQGAGRWWWSSTTWTSCARSPHTVTVLHQGKLLAEGKMDTIQNDPRVIEVYLGH